MKKTSITLAFLALALAPLVAYLVKFYGHFSEDHTRWGEFGSYLSGVYGSLALVIVAYTTHLTREQFKRQNEDSIFFNIFDSIKNRVENSEIRVGEETFSSHKCLKYIAEKFNQELSAEAVHVARNLLVKDPGSIGNTQYGKLFEVIHGPNFFETLNEDRDELIKVMSEADEFNSKWEKIKDYIGSRDCEGPRVREALRAIGSVYFYKITFKERQHHYAAALHRIMSEYGELLDGYYSNLLFVCELADASSNRATYIKYIASQLTRYEIIIIFYMLAGKENPSPDAIAFKNIGLLNRLKTFDCQSLMIDIPDTDKIEQELGNVFSR
jgi:tetratricopeptide (TPR) repeat protein